MEAGRRTQDAGQSVSSPVALMALRGLRRKSPNVDTYSHAGHGPLYVSKDINPEHVEPALRTGINYHCQPSTNLRYSILFLYKCA